MAGRVAGAGQRRDARENLTIGKALHLGQIGRGLVARLLEHHHALTL